MSSTGGDSDRRIRIAIRRRPIDAKGMETICFRQPETPLTLQTYPSPSTTTTDDERWNALIHRPFTMSGAEFFYGVSSTGVVCRPTCASRLPLRKNVRFFDTLGAAMAEGFRPCLRCRPDGVSPDLELTERVHRVRRFLERHVEAGDTSLANLSNLAGLSPGHLQRSFRAAMGVSPAQYLRCLRSQKLAYELERGSVTGAIYAAGYQSASRVYSKRSAGLGMTPGAVSRRGARQTIRYCISDSPLGRMLVASTVQGVCSIAFADTDGQLREELAERFAAAERTEDAEFLAHAVEQVLASLAEPAVITTMPLHVRATAFQQRVWTALQQIPAGQTRTYKEVAESIGQPTAARAVARACATNPIAVVVPCHRVIGADGSLTGYRWGTQRKQALLQRERAKAGA